MKKTITIPDYERLMSKRYYALLQAEVPEIIEHFFVELMYAELVDQTQISEHVVTMNSKVLLKELLFGEQIELSITYPKDANDQERKVSVFSPVGTALLGSLVGDDVSWSFQGRLAEFEILKVTYQPEAVGHYQRSFYQHY